MEVFCRNVWSVLIFAVPLHSLLRTMLLLSDYKKSSLKDLHNREVVVQEAIEKSIG